MNSYGIDELIQNRSLFHKEPKSIDSNLSSKKSKGEMAVNSNKHTGNKYFPLYKNLS